MTNHELTETFVQVLDAFQNFLGLVVIALVCVFVVSLFKGKSNVKD